MEINEPHGFITPPRLWETSSYPSELTCEWTLTGGKTRGRALSVNFHSVDLDTDPRQTPQSKDQIQVCYFRMNGYTSNEDNSKIFCHSYDRAADKRGIEDNSEIIFLILVFLKEIICCDFSLEPPC